MIKVFTCDQIKEIDRYTIDNEPVSSSDLMERAAGKLYVWISVRFSRSTRFLIIAGPGNNGGDGLALASLLWYGGFKVEVYYIDFTIKLSDDWIVNRKRITEVNEISFTAVDSIDKLPVFDNESVVIDAIFGSGLARPAEGIALETIRLINSSGCKVISIDIPSGLFGEDNSSNAPENIIKAGTTLTFQFPKLSFMFADNYPYTGDWYVLPIELHPDAISLTETPYFFTEKSDIAPILKTRGKFDHKGNFGHGLLVAGSRNKAGAAVLAARAALRTGIGLITCHTPVSGCSIIQTALPEAMVRSDINESVISDIHLEQSYNAVAAGPGIGTSDETCEAVKKILTECDKPLVLDADAINILGLHKDWISLLPAGTILTPHPKEFERIAGKTGNGYLRLQEQLSFSSRYNCIVVLKGAFTSVTFPDGRVFFNSTGNPGMATAGSGDVLTGIILSLLAQGYTPEHASVAGVYIHGLAGDISAGILPYESLMASDIIENIGAAINSIKERLTTEEKS